MIIQKTNPLPYAYPNETLNHSTPVSPSSKRKAGNANLQDSSTNTKRANTGTLFFSDEDLKEAASPPLADLFIAYRYKISTKDELFKRIDVSHLQGIVTRLESIDITNEIAHSLIQGPYYRESNPLFKNLIFFDYALKAFLIQKISKNTFYTLSLYWGCLEAQTINSGCKIECFQIFDENNNEQAKKAKEILFLSFFEPLQMNKQQFDLFVQQLQEDEHPTCTQFFTLQRPKTFEDDLYQLLTLYLSNKHPLNQWIRTGSLLNSNAQVVLPPHLINCIMDLKFGKKTSHLKPCFGFNLREPLSKLPRPFYLPSPNYVGSYNLPRKIDNQLYRTQLAIVAHDLFHIIIDSANVHLSTWIDFALYVKKKESFFQNTIKHKELFEFLIDREFHAYVSLEKNPGFAFWKTAGELLHRTIMVQEIEEELLASLFAEFYVEHKLWGIADFATNQSDCFKVLGGAPEIQIQAIKILLNIWKKIEILRQPLTPLSPASTPDID